ncbi:MAG: hypothetical protein U1E65_22565 [Myxococcota bacterium]
MTLPTDQERDAMKPGRAVLFLRTFLPYQLWRFAWINLRMLRMVLLSHRSKT